MVKLPWFLLVAMTSQLKWRHEATLDADVLLWHDVWSLLLAVLRCLIPAPATNVVESCWKRPSTMVASLDCSSILELVVLGHFSNDPAVTPINATGHQVVTLCRSVCAEKIAQLLEPLMCSRYYRRTVHVCSLVFFIVCLIVHRIRWRFGSCGTHGAEFVTYCASTIWNNWCRRGWNRREWAPQKRLFEEDL